VAGALRTGDRPGGRAIAKHLDSAFANLPDEVRTIYPRADSGFYCWEAVQAYEQRKCRFIVVARKTRRLVEMLKAAGWKRSPGTDADGQCEFLYQPDGWGKACPFLELRHEKKKPDSGDVEKPKQYQLFDTPEYTYRVFVTNRDGLLDALTGFYRGEPRPGT
jgi:hypothetical protein